MQILVLGGTGFIGPHTIRELVAQGHNVTVFNRGRGLDKLPDGVRSIVGDRAEIAAFRDQFAALQPDVVLDMRTMLAAEAQAVLDAVTGIAPRLVTISSMDVYKAFGLLIGTETGDPIAGPADENGPLRENRYPYRTEPRPSADDPAAWRYDYDKILVEELVLGSDAIDGTTLRLPMVYGDGDYQHRLLPYVQRIADARPAIILGEADAQWRTTRGYVGNVAAAITTVVTDDRARKRIFNVADDNVFTEQEWVTHIAEAAGWDGRIAIVPQDELPAELAGLGAVGQDLWLDASAIQRDLDFANPVDLPTALERTIAWEREHLATEPIDYALEDAVLARLAE